MAEETQAWPEVTSWLLHSNTENWGGFHGIFNYMAEPRSLEHFFFPQHRVPPQASVAWGQGPCLLVGGP